MNKIIICAKYINNSNNNIKIINIYNHINNKYMKNNKPTTRWMRDTSPFAK